MLKPCLIMFQSCLIMFKYMSELLAQDGQHALAFAWALSSSGSRSSTPYHLPGQWLVGSMGKPLSTSRKAAHTVPSSMMTVAAAKRGRNWCNPSCAALTGKRSGWTPRRWSWCSSWCSQTPRQRHAMQFQRQHCLTWCSSRRMLRWWNHITRRGEATVTRWMICPSKARTSSRCQRRKKCKRIPLRMRIS